MKVDAHTVAQLVRAPTTSFDEAASLIQSFANVTATDAVMKAIEEYHARTMSLLTPKERSA